MVESVRLEGKTAIVTGAGQGIGKAVAVRLAGEGAAVAVVDLNADNARSVAEEIQAGGRAAAPLDADVSDVVQIGEMVRGVVDRYGRLDILVNCAGVMQNKPFLEVTEADWDRITDVNQKGTLLCIQAAAEQMISQVSEEVRQAGRAERSHGKIVSFSSISGRRGREYHVHYAASKAAIISITQSAALAFAPFNINVNAVSPSVVKTPMWERIDREKSEMLGVPLGSASQDFVDRIPLKRAGTPEDMGAAVAFLCSADSDYITGQTLNVDGGFEMD